MNVTAPRGVLLCRPTYFDVVDVKNAFMDASVPVDRELAQRQWSALRDAFARSGFEIHEVAPLPGAEDMVFTANPLFTGVSASGERVALASQMKFPSRRPEVDAQAAALETLGYRVDRSVPPSCSFEGGGDAVWHPNRATIYCGHGWRSDASAMTFLENAFGADVVPLTLIDERFYHLDTALCALDERHALVVRAAFKDADFAEILRRFDRVIEVPEGESLLMAANATANWRGGVVIDGIATETVRCLTSHGFDVAEVDTSEFRKSGGSVYCMKQYVF
ncbi:MAG: arginine deiminase-related protein [Candidatus Eremiobacteraeota bacterium]|nr:arginine deiminase-related protein [Candidatus Eremiobacteraeota bacterium]